jgi:hypothetical protein
MHKKRSGCFVSFGALALVAIVAWFTIGGATGLLALAAGHNPLTYVSPTTDRVRDTMQRAETIVSALEQYRIRTGGYPETLDSLVPQEMAVLPLPTVGYRRWNYSRPEPTRFVLQFFEGPTYQRSWWDSAEGKWGGDH